MSTGDMTAGARRAVVILFVLTLVLAAANLLFTSAHVNRDEHRWCAVVRDQIAAAQTPRIRADFTQLGRQFGCG